MRTTVGEAGSDGGSGPSRREFLRVGGLGTLGLGLSGPMARAAGSRGEGAVILLMMVGGPSQIDSVDPKPNAPCEVRGPFRAIETAVPGVRVVEHLPGIARRMGRMTLVRSLHHDAAPIHETGHQLLGTGRLCRHDGEHPHLGSVVAKKMGASGGLPPFVILPGPLGNTGVAITHGQTSGPFGSSFGPFVLNDDPASSGYDPSAALGRARRFLDEADDLSSAGAPSRSSRLAFDLAAEPAETRLSYGPSTFGQSCLLARRLVESGVRVVVVNMFETVFGRPSWDSHGLAPFSSLDDYGRILLPMFDRAFSALIDDLENRGLLASTLMVATGGMGRTPKINASGGRDHWTGAWSAILAGGGTTGGSVIGETDKIASEPVDRPVAPADLVATMALTLGLDPGSHRPALGGGSVAIVENGSPILDAFT